MPAYSKYDPYEDQASSTLDDARYLPPGDPRAGSARTNTNIAQAQLELAGAGAQVPTSPTAPIPGPEPGGDGGGGGISPFSFTIPPYTGPMEPHYTYSPIPVFVPPNFQAPTAEQALNSPGYQFRLGEGQRALEQAAASKGLLRTGGTLKNLSAWSQNFASQEYQNVFDRALQQYDRKYQSARDVYSPRLLEWQTKTAGMQRAKDLGFQRAWEAYTFPIEQQNALEAAILAGGYE